MPAATTGGSGTPSSSPRTRPPSPRIQHCASAPAPSWTRPWGRPAFSSRTFVTPRTARVASGCTSPPVLANRSPGLAVHDPRRLQFNDAAGCVAHVPQGGVDVIPEHAKPSADAKRHVFVELARELSNHLSVLSVLLRAGPSAPHQ